MLAMDVLIGRLYRIGIVWGKDRSDTDATMLEVDVFSNILSEKRLRLASLRW